MTGESSRGVSEVVSFVLVFGLVVSTIGIVYVSGFSGLDDVQENERLSNAERAFDVLADNMDDIYREDAPSRATEIKLSEAQLMTTDATNLRVEITNVGAPNVYSKQIDPIVYSTGGDTEIVYEAGAVIRTDGSNGIMKEDPPFLFTKDDGSRQAIIPIIQTRSVDSSSLAGSTTVLIRSEQAVSRAMTVRRDPATTYDVELTFETTETRAPIWESYFEERIVWSSNDCTTSGGTVTCIVTVDELYVTWTGIDVWIQN